MDFLWKIIIFIGAVWLGIVVDGYFRRQREEAARIAERVALGEGGFNSEP